MIDVKKVLIILEEESDSIEFETNQNSRHL